jgi:hypothetical protein
MKDEKVQELAMKFFGKVPNNDEMIELIKNSEQDDELKNHLILGDDKDLRDDDLSDVIDVHQYVVYYVNDNDGLISAFEDWGHSHMKSELPLIVSAFVLAYKDDSGRGSMIEIRKTLKNVGHRRRIGSEHIEYNAAGLGIDDAKCSRIWRQLARKYPEVKKHEDLARSELNTTFESYRVVLNDAPAVG